MIESRCRMLTKERICHIILNRRLKSGDGTSSAAVSVIRDSGGTRRLHREPQRDYDLRAVIQNIKGQ